MTPLSTYRLQLNRDFDLAAATRLVPYLRALGVDWLYLSPIFSAQPGSAHGYDVIDPTSVNPELGGRDALDELSRRAHEAGLRILIDIVPNHQAATKENRRWQEALESRTPGWFDVRWIGDQVQYRRFFDVDGLVGVRVEDEVVFRETHALIFELVERRVVDGLRVDHVDGLADPGQYLERLDRATGGAYTVVEKILARDELLPGWPVAGTTGYEAGDALTGLSIDPEGRGQLEGALLAENSGVSFAEVECASKAYVLDRLFQPEWTRVRELLGADELVPALRVVTLGLDVYRTYGDSPEDEKRCTRATSGVDPQTGEALRAVLLGNPRSELSTRWQQLTGPVMAKGHEDTACYRYPALLAQNEVGGDPGWTAHDAIDRFHQLADGYRGLIGTSTHDSKRSEDVRARLCALSERPEAFAIGVDRWRDLVEPAPDVTAVESRFVAQTLLGAWPLASGELPAFRTRMAEYLTKALREAKEKTNWLVPDEEHERRVIELAERTIADDGRLLHDAFGRLVEEVMFFGALNSLSMLTWKLAMPGTPDIYRGCELWDLSLVDPDNRRPVDFEARTRVLRRLDGSQPVGEDELLRDWRSGAIKMHVTASGLRARRAFPELFGRGEYAPVEGPENVLAFARHLGDAWAVAIAPRFGTQITRVGEWPLGADAWGDSTLVVPDPARTEIRLADALSDLPVALVVLP
ncbi:MAG: (1-_4)-alpha-D-glucan 1-alpha-D-glucosylmutase [Actinomycetota bacterium]|nr:(1->4)-alpha-D-glucan 1-alpha-D-glucosylmutase [Actinomycetota bacterium]